MGCHSDWVALLTAFTTAISFLIAILTPPNSGPFCVQNCVGYPDTDIAAHIPRDFLWMDPALLPAPLFVMMVSGLHERAAIDRRQFSRLAIAFGVFTSTLLTADYFHPAARDTDGHLTVGLLITDCVPPGRGT